MMNSFITFHTSPNIIFGANSLQEITEILNKQEANRILVITDKGIVNSGLSDRIKEVLESFKYDFYDEIEATPGIDTIQKITDFGRKEKYDFIIGYGGGSPMDAAKAVSVLLTNEGPVENYLGKDTIRKPGVKKILIPTTAGTGSEVTKYAVLAIRESGVKTPTGIFDKFLLPEWAIIDPTLMLSMPPSLTAYTGMDAFSHAAEAYVNNLSNFLMEPFALEAIKRISFYIEAATVEGTDIETRTNMAAGSLMAGIAFSQTGTGLTHALAETIQIPYNIPHGAAIGTILPHVISFNLTSKPDKYKKIAARMGLDVQDATETEVEEKLVGKIKEINKRIGIPGELSSYGIHENDLKKIAEETVLHGEGYLRKNPRMANEQDLLHILKNAYRV
jgi:alcohol dehydrogenase